MSSKSSKKEDFAIGNLADEMLDTTLELCGKDENKTPRFPKLLYPSYVDRIVNTALDAHEYIFSANGTRLGEKREEFQQMAARKLQYMNHLIRVAAMRGWISDRQCDRWQKICTKLMWAVVKWSQSDAQRYQAQIAREEAEMAALIEESYTKESGEEYREGNSEEDADNPPF